MDYASHIHIMINHLPLDATVFALVVLLYGTLRDEETPIRIGLATLIVAAIITGMTYRTGPSAAAAAGHVDPEAASRLALHSAIGHIAQICSLVTGVAAVFGIWYFQPGQRVRREFAAVVMALSLATIVLSGFAFVSGKRLGHIDLFQGASMAPTQPDIVAILLKTA